MLNRNIEALKEIAQTIINDDPGLRTLQARYREIGFSETESLSMTLGRAFVKRESPGGSIPGAFANLTR
jgi:hypothetical protein